MTKSVQRMTKKPERFRDRPPRILKEKKTGKFYIMSEGEKYYVDKPTKGNITIINQIINKLDKSKRRQASSRRAKQKIKESTAETRSEPSFMRSPTDSFNLMLPYFTLMKFQSYNQLEEVNKQIKEIKNILPELKGSTVSLPALPEARPVGRLTAEEKGDEFDNLDELESKNERKALENNEKRIRTIQKDYDDIETEDKKDLLSRPPRLFSGVSNITFTPTFLSPRNIQSEPAKKKTSFVEKLKSPFKKIRDFFSKKQGRTQSLPLPEREEEEEEEEEKVDKRSLSAPSESKKQIESRARLYDKMVIIAKNLREEQERERKIEPNVLPDEPDIVEDEDKVFELPVMSKTRGVEVVNLKDYGSIGSYITENKLNNIQQAERPIILRYIDKDGKEVIKSYKTKGDFKKEFKAKTFNKYVDKDKQNKGTLNKVKTKLDEEKFRNILGEGTKGFIIGDIKKSITGRGKEKSKPLSEENQILLDICKMCDKESEGKYNVALWDSELLEMLSPYREFFGIVMRNEVKDLLEKAEEEGVKKFGFVQNLDWSEGEGTHWVGWYVDLTDNKMICYYDPFGKSAQKDVLTEIKKWVKRQVPYFIKFKSNRMSQQKFNSNRCGYHVAKFLIHMFKTGDFKEATDYDSIAESEKEAEKMEKKFKKFGYI